ncbi:MAG: hypothetical protein R3B70_24270 [Polyangiaceae bacterium]
MGLRHCFSLETSEGRARTLARPCPRARFSLPFDWLDQGSLGLTADDVKRAAALLAPEARAGVVSVAREWQGSPVGPRPQRWREP